MDTRPGEDEFRTVVEGGERFVPADMEFEPVRGFLGVGPAEDPECHLLMQVNILGASHHLEAIEVVEEDHCQAARHPSLDGKLDDFYGATGSGDPWETVTIRGRQYVLCMTPYCS